MKVTNLKSLKMLKRRLLKKEIKKIKKRVMKPNGGMRIIKRKGIMKAKNPIKIIIIITKRKKMKLNMLKKVK